MLLMSKLYSLDQVKAFLKLLYKSFLNVRKVVHFEIANDIVELMISICRNNLL